MAAVTAIVSLVVSIIAITCSPVMGLCSYLAVTIWYPQPLTLSIGTIDFSSSRIVLLALSVKMLCQPKVLRRVKLDTVDFFLIASFMLPTLAFMTQGRIAPIVENRGGLFIDTVLPYILTRVIVTDREKLADFVKVLVIMSAPFAILGAYESVTGHNPFGFMAAYYNWGMARESGDPYLMRYGFYRASLSIGNYIVFGLFLAGVAPIGFGLLRLGGWRRVTVIFASGIILLGALSSMSSAPVFSLAISAMMLAVYPWRRWWPALLFMFVMYLLFVEVYSNRHFYHVLAGLSFDTETAFYRIALIEEAFGGGMTGHWLSGFGDNIGIGPGADNTNFNWECKDLTNIYIAKLATSGLIGLVPFLFLNYMFYRRLYQGGRLARDRAVSWMIWCLGATLVGWNIAFLTVSAMGIVNTLLHMTIAICCNAPDIARKANATGRGVLDGDNRRNKEWKGRGETVVACPISRQ